MFGSMGIEVVDSEQRIREPKEGEEGQELDLTPGALDKTPAMSMRTKSNACTKGAVESRNEISRTWTGACRATLACGTSL
jgi:hypothetical protein